MGERKYNKRVNNDLLTEISALTQAVEAFTEKLKQPSTTLQEKTLGSSYSEQEDLKHCLNDVERIVSYAKEMHESDVVEALETVAYRINLYLDLNIEESFGLRPSMEEVAKECSNPDLGGDPKVMLRSLGNTLVTWRMQLQFAGARSKLGALPQHEKESSIEAKNLSDFYNWIRDAFQSAYTKEFEIENTIKDMKSNYPGWEKNLTVLLKEKVNIWPQLKASIIDQLGKLRDHQNSDDATKGKLRDEYNSFIKELLDDFGAGGSGDIYPATRVGMDSCFDYVEFRIYTILY